MDGIHLLGEWYGCPADLPEMNRADVLRERCIEAVERGWTPDGLIPRQKLIELGMPDIAEEIGVDGPEA